MKKSAFNRSMAVAALLCVLLGAPSAFAFEIQSGFSDPCHETMTLQAANDSFADEFSVSEEVPLPDSDVWEQVSESILADLGVEYSDERERFLLVSLAVGARWPDTRGHALLDSSQIRKAHVDTFDQYNHGLRRATDDFEEGNVAAIAGTREVIRRNLEAAARILALPADQQLLERSVVVDYYGEIALEIWAPAFYLGFAAHAFQDSFSHSIRTDDLKRILHVMNFTEATRGEHELDRDGLPHSAAMDDCEVRASKIAASAQRATTELFLAFYAEEVGDVSGATDLVLDEWLAYEPGCTPGNNFCDSQWLTIAEKEPARPILPKALGCQTASSRHFALWAMVLAFCAFWFRRRSRKRAGGPEPV